MGLDASSGGKRETTERERRSDEAAEPLEEDCVTAILVGMAVLGDHPTLPPDSEVDRLCAWYLSQLE